MEKTYLETLSKLRARIQELPNSRFMAIGKIQTLITLNMRYEAIMLDRSLKSHPYVLVGEFLDDALKQIETWASISFIEDDKSSVSVVESEMEEMHQDLFQHLWTQFDRDGYISRIERFEHRLAVNGLADGFLDGMDVVDFGCGHGNFAHSFLNKGAKSVLGIDFGADSIRYAAKARDDLGVSEDRLRFREASVYDTGEPDERFDMAVQNGVFHHLDDEDRAYREVHRVLKPGGWFWVYTDGAGTISAELWDASRAALSGLPAALITEVTGFLNIGEGKRYHLGDGLNAVYRHTTYEALVARLSSIGFGDFRRLVGGFETDMDPDVIARDRWGPEKYGDGDIRLLCRKQ